MTVIFRPPSAPTAAREIAFDAAPVAAPRVARSEGGGHVLVCVRGERDDCELVRRGRALACDLDARMTVLQAFALGNQAHRRGRLSEVRRLARALEAPLVELPVFSPVDGIVEFAQRRQVTHLVLSEGSGAHREAGRPWDLAAQLGNWLQGVDLFVVRVPVHEAG